METNTDFTNMPKGIEVKLNMKRANLWTIIIFSY